jgi:hypothetical protein
MMLSDDVVGTSTALDNNSSVVETLSRTAVLN